MSRSVHPAPILLVLALALSGCATVGLSRPTRSPATVLECEGERSARPTLVLEAGAFGGPWDWAVVAKDLAASGWRVCAYDRAAAAPRTEPDMDRSPIAVAKRLEPLVTREAGDRPVILAGHSNGGLYAEAFARLWPERTAGLLMVDAVGSEVKDHPKALADLEAEERLTAMAPFARAVGLTRLAPLLDEVDPSPDMVARRRRAWTDRESIAVASAEVRAFTPGLGRVAALAPLRPSIPVAVVVASHHPDDATDEDWRAAQVEPARRSDCGVVVDVVASHTGVLDAQRSAVTAMAAWLAGAQAWTGRGKCPGRFAG